jgi:hypothetical protein
LARLYADENFPCQVTEALRNLGHDVVTSQEAGNAGEAINDEQVLGFVITQKRAVVTLDRRDFIRLHACQTDHAGIIVCTQDADTEGQASRIHLAILEAGDLTNQLLRVNRPQ